MKGPRFATGAFSFGRTALFTDCALIRLTKGKTACQTCPAITKKSSWLLIPCLLALHLGAAHSGDGNRADRNAPVLDRAPVWGSPPLMMIHLGPTRVSACLTPRPTPRTTSPAVIFIGGRQLCGAVSGLLRLGHTRESGFAGVTMAATARDSSSAGPIFFRPRRSDEPRKAHAGFTLGFLGVVILMRCAGFGKHGHRGFETQGRLACLAAGMAYATVSIVNCAACPAQSTPSGSRYGSLLESSPLSITIPWP